VPRHRLERAAIAAALGNGTGTGTGARAVAGFDEDATSMGVEAARPALAASGAVPRSLHFATTAPPYADKTNAVAIHAALSLPASMLAVDLAGSVRNAIGALAAAERDAGLAVLADLRTGRPGSADERDGGDAAAAFLFGDDEPLAVIEGRASRTAEFLDRWRIPGTATSQVWEERFGAGAYAPLIEGAVGAALAEAGAVRVDHVVVSSPHARARTAARRRLAALVAEPALVGVGAAPAPVAPDPGVGYAGAADLGVALADVLDRARPGETILAVSAADGCDALVLRTTDALPERRAAVAVRDQVAAGREVAYNDFLTWRGMLEREPPRRPEPERPAGPPSARTERWKFAFTGSRCEACDRVHLPPQRVCAGCGAVDRMSAEPMSTRRARVATFTVDRLAFSPAPPVVDVVIDFEGGGRYMCELTDADPAQVGVGDVVEMTFRRMFTANGVHNYFWKARPVQ
jgi:hydroxymethylglutaryl-CoA synthase